MISILVIGLVSIMSQATNNAFSTRAEDKPYVEFDLTPLPCEANRKWQLKIRVETARVIFSDNLVTNGVTERFATCEDLVLELRNKGFEAEVIDKSKVRIYGAKTDGKFHSAIKGTVESPDLKKDELPKITVVGKKG